MSAPSWEEMEGKRLEMINSFREVAAAMTNCVKVIDEYTSLSPVHLSKPDLLQPLTAGGPLAQALASGLGDPSYGGGINPATGKKERKKKEKKIKDPNAPKRPPSAYILFQNDVRDEIRRSNPNIAYKEILHIISAKWKDLADDQKKVYEDAYQNAHSTFRAEEEAYTSKKDFPVPPPVAAEEDFSSDSDSDSSSEESVVPAPTTLASATATDKKEKKRKNKEEEASKKKKSKD
ncbi:nonhistone protein 6 [Cryptococcus wingfieldii CBS 7118]|uniref:Nonhistone protein 6 n=1 Tax=Cryptococcus wingfieldii CBS 7118 TaxID=1295528 RepID=A0A1E3IVT3_9TREE|nr:nonhistone protein 6 [Cryptococcus wingfieldii CBS 7118]ODN92730.1 nonhistone protein 6 [Cryptococcus wingfieldii CBS 7118]